MRRMEVAVVVIALVLMLGALWAVPAQLGPESRREFEGDVFRTTVPLAGGAARDHSWEITVTFPRAARHFELLPALPYNMTRTDDRGPGPVLRLALTVNEEQVYSSTFNNTAGVAMLSSGDPARLSNLKTPPRWTEGENRVRLEVSVAPPAASPGRPGTVDVSVGPAKLDWTVKDVDADGVADAVQPVAFLPSYVLAPVAGIALGALGVGGLRVRERRRNAGP